MSSTAPGRSALAALILLPALALAADPKAATPVSDGPLTVLEAKLCTEIAKEGAAKYDCTREVDLAEGVKAGTLAYLWFSFRLADGQALEDLAVQVRQGAVVRETKDVQVRGGAKPRLRQWTGVRLAKAGTWTLVLLREDRELVRFTVPVH